MKGLTFPRWAPLLAAGLALVLVPSTGRGQAKSERIKFESADGVELHGDFYPSGKGARAPCVIMLHATGGHRKEEGWVDLAAKLQGEFAVLAFDFRGHGDSTEIQENFWRVNFNNKYVKGGSRKKAISYKDFNTAYYPYLVNDIAAAKRYLDQQSEAGQCNSSNIIVIGARDGATLGALWIAWTYNYRIPIRNPFGVVIGKGEPEGEDVACAIWLSMTPYLPAGKTTAMHVAEWFTTKSPDVKEKVPMAFLYGDQDTTSQKFAAYLVGRLKSAKGGTKVDKTTGARAVKGTKLTGRDLLGKKSLDTEDWIMKYLKDVIDKRGINAPKKRDMKMSPPVLVPVDKYLR